jgi:hypothetical protein
MKSLKKYQMGLLAFFVIISVPLFGQRSGVHFKGNGNVIRSSSILPEFSKLKVSGVDHVYILTKDNQPYTLVIETDENLVDKIEAVVVNHTLSFKYKNLKPTRLNFYVTVPDLSSINSSGAANVIAVDSLQGKMLKVNASGASNVKLNIDYDRLLLVASGAADIHLAGRLSKMNVVLSGAADVKAAQLTVDSVFAKASGASNMKVNATHFINKNISGVADIQLVNKPSKTVQIKTRVTAPKVMVYGNKPGRNNDTTRVEVGSLHVEVVDGDTTKVSVGDHTLVVDDHGNVKWKRSKRPRFNGHWGGVELGIGGYVNNQGDAVLDPKYAFMDLQYEKSTSINLNLFEQNIPFNKAKTIGMITGLGFTFNDYRFTQPTYLPGGSSTFEGYYIRNVEVAKSKLSIYYVNVPFILEFQTNNIRRSRRFHLGMGIVLNARFNSHTKIYFKERNKQYFLEDPLTHVVGTTYYTTPDGEKRNIVKSRGSFNLNPFLVNGTLRFGYGNISLFANVALTPMFQKQKGPELYQWSAGITLAPW